MKCAYCHDELDVAVTCIECQTVMHFECWDEHPQCPTLGCDVCLQSIEVPWLRQIASFFFALFMLAGMGLNRVKVDLSKRYGSGQVASNKPREEPFRTVTVDCVRTDPHDSHRGWVTVEDSFACLPDIESIREERFKLEPVSAEDLYVSYRHLISAETLESIEPMTAENCPATLKDPVPVDRWEPLCESVTKFLTKNYWLPPLKQLEWTDFELIRRRVVGLRKRKKQPPELTLLPFQTLG